MPIGALKPVGELNPIVVLKSIVVLKPIALLKPIVMLKAKSSLLVVKEDTTPRGLQLFGVITGG
jgi:hypothetical protein